MAHMMTVYDARGLRGGGLVGDVVEIYAYADEIPRKYL